MIRLTDPSVEVQRTDGALTIRCRRPPAFRTLMALFLGFIGVGLVVAACEPDPNEFTFSSIAVRFLALVAAAGIVLILVNYVFGRSSFRATANELLTDSGRFRKNLRLKIAASDIAQFFASYVHSDSVAPKARICLLRSDGSFEVIGDDYLTVVAVLQMIRELNGFYGLHTRRVEGFLNVIDRSLASDDLEVNGSASLQQPKSLSIKGGLGFSFKWTRRFANLFFLMGIGLATPTVVYLMVPGIQVPDVSYWTLSTALVIALLWLGFAAALNKTTLVATGQQFQVKHGPIPIPWMSSRSFERNQFIQFWPGPSGSKLFLIDADHRPISLVERLTAANCLQAVADQLNALYGISAEPVASYAMEVGDAKPLPLVLDGVTVSEGRFNFKVMGNVGKFYAAVGILTVIFSFFIIAFASTTKLPWGVYVFFLACYFFFILILVDASPIKTEFEGFSSALTVKRTLFFGRKRAKSIDCGDVETFAAVPHESGATLYKVLGEKNEFICQLKSRELACALAVALNKFFELQEKTGSDLKAPPGPNSAAPLLLAIHRTDQELTIAFNTRSPISAIAIQLGLMITAFSLLGIANIPTGPETALFAIILVLSIGVIIAGVGNYMNRIEMKASASKLDIRNGPIPWTRVRSIPMGEVREWLAHPNSEVSSSFLAAVGYRSDDFGFKAIATSLPTKGDAVAIATALNEFYSLPAGR